MKSDDNSSGCGTIQPGDPHRYLGHFRSPDVIKRGHNVGAPGKKVEAGAVGAGVGQSATSQAPAIGAAGPSKPAVESGGGFQTPKPANPNPNQPVGASPARPTFNPATNPIAAARQTNKANIAAAKATGGNVKQTRVENLARMSGARTARKERDDQGLHASDMAALKGAKGAAKATRQAQHQAPIDAKRQAVQGAKQGLQSATAGVRSARQALRGAIRGGDAAGAGKDFAALQGAKSARKTARQGVKSARRGPVGLM